jgi:glutamine amidotransferase
MTQIAIIDYNVGNLKSIINALEWAGAEVVLTRDKKVMFSADGCILPGVGAFSHGIGKLKEYKIFDTLQSFRNSQQPLLGICLGMQMLFSQSEEFGMTEGLNLIEGKIKKIPLLDKNCQKLPHISWNELSRPEYSNWEGTILDGLTEQSNMYFVHSFAAEPHDKSDILAETVYSNHKFCSVVKKNNIYGCQFHPEKSALEGLTIMKNFVKICKELKNV